MKLLIEFKKNKHTGRADIVLPDGIWRGTSMPWDEAEECAAATAPQDGLRAALADIASWQTPDEMREMLAKEAAQYPDAAFSQNHLPLADFERHYREAIEIVRKALAQEKGRSDG